MSIFINNAIGGGRFLVCNCRRLRQFVLEQCNFVLDGSEICPVIQHGPRFGRDSREIQIAPLKFTSIDSVVY